MYESMGTMYDDPDDILDGEGNSGEDSRPQSPPLSPLRRSGRHKARASDNAKDDHSLVNHFWPLFSHTVLEDVRDNTGVIVPVPRLQASAAAYRPLQIFHDRLEHSVVRSLSNVQRKVVSMGGGGGTLVRMGRRMGLRLEGMDDTIVSQEIYLREEHFTVTPKDSHIQVIRRRNIRPDGESPPAVAKIKIIFDVVGVTKLTTPPRDLQGVRVDCVQDVGAHRSFNYIYETFLAEYVKCKTVSEGTGVAEPQIRVGVVRNCPIAYRFAKIKVNRDGVVTSVDLNVTSRDLRNLAVPKLSMADVVSITGNWVH